jgi:hypothetical protein
MRGWMEVEREMVKVFDGVRWRSKIRRIRRGRGRERGRWSGRGRLRFFLSKKVGLECSGRGRGRGKGGGEEEEWMGVEDGIDMRKRKRIPSVPGGAAGR